MPSKKRSRRTIVSHERFMELAGTVIGLPIGHAWRGHGSALFLELGRLIPRHRPVAQASRPLKPMGECSVMVQWSWRIERARSIELGSWSTERRIDAGIPGLVGPTVTTIDTFGRLPELVLGLSDGRWVSSFMTAEGQPEWTLFLRDGSWLTVEGGRMVHDTQNRRAGQTHRAASA